MKYLNYRIEVNETTRAFIVAALRFYGTHSGNSTCDSWARSVAESIASLNPVDSAEDGPEIGILTAPSEGRS